MPGAAHAGPRANGVPSVRLQLARLSCGSPCVQNLVFKGSSPRRALQPHSLHTYRADQPRAPAVPRREGPAQSKRLGLLRGTLRAQPGTCISVQDSDHLNWSRPMPVPRLGSGELTRERAGAAPEGWQVPSGWTR